MPAMPLPIITSFIFFMGLFLAMAPPGRGSEAARQGRGSGAVRRGRAPQAATFSTCAWRV